MRRKKRIESLSMMTIVKSKGGKTWSGNVSGSKGRALTPEVL